MKYSLLLFLLFSQILSAQNPGNLLSLEDCIKIAKEKNFDIQLIRPTIDAAAADLTQSFGAYLPSANVNAGYSRSGGQIFNDLGLNPNQYSLNARMNYTIFDGFAREASFKRSETNLNATILNSEQTVSNVLISIYRNYIAVIKNYQVVNVRRQDVIASKKSYERIQAYFESGASNIGDVYALESDLASKELQLALAENELDRSKTSLLTSIGLDPADNYDFVESSIPNEVSIMDMTEFRKEVGTMQSAFNEALKNRSDYLATEQSFEAAKSTVKIARASYIPSINANAGWIWSNDEISNFTENGRTTFGFNFNLPVFQNFQRNNQVQNAQLGLEQQKINRNRVEQDIKSNLQTSYLNLQAAENQLELSDKALKSFEKNFEIAKKRFELGAIDITAFLLADTQYTKSKLDKINAVYSYYQAQKDLLWSMGKLENQIIN